MLRPRRSLSPGGYFASLDLYFPATLSGIRLVPLDKVPELLGVVKLLGVAEFVHQDVANEMRREEQEVSIQADGALLRAAAPPGLLPSDGDSGERGGQISAKLLKPGDQYVTGFLLQPFIECFCDSVRVIHGALNGQSVVVAL